MSFNGADSAGSSSLNPSATLGGSSGSHEITAGDIAVIVGAVVVFSLIVFGIFYYRQLRERRARAGELMEMGSVENGVCGEDDGKKQAAAAPIWKFMGWKDKEREGNGVEQGTRASTAQDVRGGKLLFLLSQSQALCLGSGYVACR